MEDWVVRRKHLVLIMFSPSYFIPISSSSDFFLPSPSTFTSNSPGSLPYASLAMNWVTPKCRIPGAYAAIERESIKPLTV